MRILDFAEVVQKLVFDDMIDKEKVELIDETLNSLNTETVFMIIMLILCFALDMVCIGCFSMNGILAGILLGIHVFVTRTNRDRIKVQKEYLKNERENILSRNQPKAEENIKK